MSHLSLLNQIFDSACDILDRRVQIHAMLVEEVQRIHFETLQGCLCHVLDVLRAAIERSPPTSIFRVGPPAELGRNNYLAAERKESFTNEFLIRQRSINLCGVEEGNAMLDCCADDFDCLVLVGCRPISKAQAHAAKAQR